MYPLKKSQHDISRGAAWVQRGLGRVFFMEYESTNIIRSNVGWYLHDGKSLAGNGVAAVGAETEGDYLCGICNIDKFQPAHDVGSAILHTGVREDRESSERESG
jgi:hypothetical protein